MQIEKCELEGVLLISPNVISDHRGYFFEAYNYRKFRELANLDIQFIQDNESRSCYGTLRGLHFQKPPFAQSKLLRVIDGEILDVIVDLRKSSKSFGKWKSFVLSASNKKQLFVPKGFAHGFVVLSSEASLLYKVDAPYAPEHDTGIRYNDPELNIDWKIEEEKIILSEKDNSLPLFSEYLNDKYFE